MIIDRFELVERLGIDQKICTSSSLSLPPATVFDRSNANSADPKILYGTFALLVDIDTIQQHQLVQHVQGIHGRWKRVELSRPPRAIHRMTHKVGSPLPFCRLDFLKSEPERWRELNARVSSSCLSDVILFEG